MICLTILSATFQLSAQCASLWLLIYDGRVDPPESVIPKAVVELLKKDALPRAKKEWLTESDFQVVGAAEGSFTAKGSKQKAYLYSYNQTGDNMGINGIVVLEGQKIVAHFGYEGGWESGLTRLPDISGDGLDDLALHTGMTNQGYTVSGVIPLALQPNTVKSFGAINVYENDEGTLDKVKWTHASRIFAKSGRVPEFKEEKFQLQRKQWQRISEAPIKPDKVSIEFRDLLH